MVSTTATNNVRLKSIALPPEHGAWGFLLEPVVLGLLIAPSLAGGFLALAVVGAFLIRHPLKLAFTDWRRGKRYARTALAERVILAYGVLTIIGLVLAIALAGWEIMLPLLMAAPLVLMMLASYVQNRGRELIPELAGASALAVTASGVALAGGASSQTAFALWVILNARNIPSILYVRARLRLEKEKPFSGPLVFTGQPDRPDRGPGACPTRRRPIVGTAGAARPADPVRARPGRPFPLSPPRPHANDRFP